MGKSNEGSDAAAKMNDSLGKIGSFLKQQGAWTPALSEFYTDVVHSMAHRMVDSLTTQLAVVLLQRMNAPQEHAQALLSGLQQTEDQVTGDLPHDLVLRYATDLNLGLVGEGYEVLAAYLGSHVTIYANKRLDELGFTPNATPPGEDTE